LKRFLIATGILLSIAASANAQSLDELNIQFHGYATQGFLYTTNNNILTTNSSDGSPVWTEAVVNLSAQPVSKLHISVQARYFMLGTFGNAITLDYAMADYKVNDHFGVRFGKVKTPRGLFNEVQDIDPAYMWSLLPQSVYPISNRNSLLSHYGGVVFGTLNLSPKLGKLEYRGWGGEMALGGDDGYFLPQRELGITYPNGLSSATYGAALHWKTPLPGLMIGASADHLNASTSAFVATISGYGTFNGSFALSHVDNEEFFAQYEKRKLMVAGEYSRIPYTYTGQIPGLYTQSGSSDARAWYAMASYKLTEKLSAGLYDSQYVDRQSALGPGRYQKDWAVSGRYDFNGFLYAKAEQHFLDGTALNYDTALNPGGLKPSSRLTILKLGVSF